VYRALDQGSTTMDEFGNSTPVPVVLKLMRIKSQFLRELNSRKNDFDENLVIKVIDSYPPLESLDSMADEIEDFGILSFHNKQIPKADAERLFCSNPQDDYQRYQCRAHHGKRRL